MMTMMTTSGLPLAQARACLAATDGRSFAPHKYLITVHIVPLSIAWTAPFASPGIATPTQM